VIIVKKTATIHMRVDGDLKESAENLLNSLGLSITEVMNIFLYQVVLNEGLPFEVKKPRYNVITELAMQEVRKMNDDNSKTYSNSKELFEELDEDC
jgi:DNA-damage-inducible protein J